jgi:hypothetical protein
MPGVPGSRLVVPEILAVMNFSYFIACFFSLHDEAYSLLSEVILCWKMELQTL